MVQFNYTSKFYWFIDADRNLVLESNDGCKVINPNIDMFEYCLGDDLECFFGNLIRQAPFNSTSFTTFRTKLKLLVPSDIRGTISSEYEKMCKEFTRAELIKQFYNSCMEIREQIPSEYIK